VRREIDQPQRRFDAIGLHVEALEDERGAFAARVNLHAAERPQPESVVHWRG
jgi:hypothetical protein